MNTYNIAETLEESHCGEEDAGAETELHCGLEFRGTCSLHCSRLQNEDNLADRLYTQLYVGLSTLTMLRPHRQ